MPLSVVSVGRLATDYSCIARHRYPGTAAASRGSVTAAFAIPPVEGSFVCETPGVSGNVWIGFAMTLVGLLRLPRLAIICGRRKLCGGNLRGSGESLAAMPACGTGAREVRVSPNTQT